MPRKYFLKRATKQRRLGKKSLLELVRYAKYLAKNLKRLGKLDAMGSGTEIADYLSELLQQNPYLRKKHRDLQQTLNELDSKTWPSKLEGESFFRQF